MPVNEIRACLRPDGRQNSRSSKTVVSSLEAGLVERTALLRQKSLKPCVTYVKELPTLKHGKPSGYAAMHVHRRFTEDEWRLFLRRAKRRNRSYRTLPVEKWKEIATEAEVFV